MQKNFKFLFIFRIKYISHKMAALTFTHKKRVATSPLECKDCVAFRPVWLQRTCQMSSEIRVLYFLRCRKNWRKVREYNLFKSMWVVFTYFALFISLNKENFCSHDTFFAVNYTAIVLSNDCFVWIAYSFWQLLRNKLHNPFCQHSAILVLSIVIFSTSSKLKKPLLFFWGRFICNMTHVAVAFGLFFLL